MESYFLYKITNNVNDKLYIGMTKRPKARMYEHFYGKRTDSISLIKQAVIKHGVDNFTFEVICEGSKDYIIDLEMKAIEAYDTINTGYNIRAGGVDCGGGHKIEKRSDDQPVYVKGFWFPKNRIAKEKLGITDANFYKWKKQGTLGDCQRLRVDSTEVPTYVGGFWFDSLSRACDRLNQSKGAISARIKRGTVEQEVGIGRRRFGEDNPMAGKSGFDHPNSKAVEVLGVIYGSLLQAARESGFTRKTISYRIKNKFPGFAWVESEQE